MITELEHLGNMSESTKLKLKGMKIIHSSEHPDHRGTGHSVLTRVTFENKYGVSLSRFSGSFGYEQGLWELTVLCRDGDMKVFLLTQYEVLNKLIEISELK